MTDDSKGPDLDIDAIAARAMSATPGPWEVNTAHGLCVLGLDPHGPCVADMEGATWHGRGQDAAFIAASRTDVPALCARVRELESVPVKAMRAVLSMQATRIRDLEAALAVSGDDAVAAAIGLANEAKNERDAARAERDYLDGVNSGLLKLANEAEGLRRDVAEAMLLVESAEFKAGQAIAERDKAQAQLAETERHAELTYREHSFTTLHERLVETERKLAECQAGAAAFRVAIEELRVSSDEDEAMDAWTSIHSALASDAGRALAERVRLLEAVVAPARQMRGCDAAIDAALHAPGGPDVERVHEAAGQRCVTQHDIDRDLAALDAHRAGGR